MVNNPGLPNSGIRSQEMRKRKVSLSADYLWQLTLISHQKKWASWQISARVVSSLTDSGTKVQLICLILRDGRSRS